MNTREIPAGLQWVQQCSSIKGILLFAGDTAGSCGGAPGPEGAQMLQSFSQCVIISLQLLQWDLCFKA